MKILIFSGLFCLLCYTGNSQTISPSNSGEFCPQVEYTFNATILKAFDRIIAISPAVITQQPTGNVGSNFTFKGIFADVNAKQTFRVYFTDGTFYDYDFKKIKSLFFSTRSTAFPACNVIRPNQTQAIVFPRCQITSATISFPTISWLTNNENPELCFGSVTDYEYLLPSGWSMGGNTSNGSTWLPGGNSMVVTSNLTTGDVMDIQIRASNRSCGTGLSANGPISTVRISRPEPSISLTSPQGVIICAGGSANFTLGNIPAGATVLWTYTSNTGGVVILVNATSPTVTVNNTNQGNARITLTGTVTHCSYTYPRTIEVGLGTGVNTVSYTMLTVNCEGTRAYFYANVIPVEGATNYAWYAKDLSVASNPFVFKEGGIGLYNIDFPLGGSDRNYTVYVDVTTPCGNVTSNLGEGTFYAPSCLGGAGGARIALSPNPSQNNVTLTLLDEYGKLEKDKTKNILEIQISDKLGNKVLVRKLSSVQKVVDIDISSLKTDNYFVKIWNGETWLSSQLSKK